MNNSESTEIRLGHIVLHRDIPERISFTDAYYALRRHEHGEIQGGLPDCLIEQANEESQELGWHVTYHIAETGEVFKVETNEKVGETRLSLGFEQRI